MVVKFKYLLFKKFYFLYFLLKIAKVINEYKNEISLIINATRSTEIIDYSFYDNISQI